jgi:hypothetical protein
MKSVNRLLFGLLSLNAAAVGAQSTQPLLESGKTWSCYGDYFFYNVKYRLGADTVIGELVYKKMLASTDVQPFVFNPETAMYKSAVRESNGQVFVVEKGFLTEHLLYDFNLNTGDEVQFYRPSGNINQGVLPNYVTGKVYKTNQVTINGVSRKRIYIHDPFMVNQLPAQALSQLDSQADIWIEGLGAKTGLFSRMPQWGVVGPQPHLMACVEQDGIVLYQNNVGYTFDPTDVNFILPAGDGGTTGGGGSSTGGGNDTLITAIGAQISPTQLSLYPNPATNFFNIQPITGRALVGVYDTDGNKIKEQEYMPVNNKIRVNIEGMKDGLYTVRVRGAGISKNFRLLVTAP